MQKKVFIALIFSCLSVLGVHAQPFITAKLDTDQTLIGKPVQLSLYAEFESGQDYSWPSFTDSINGLEIWEIGQFFNEDKKGLTRLKQTYELASFDSGFYIIKPIPFILNSDTLFSDPVLVQVNTVELSQEQEMYDIREPRALPFPWMYVVLIVLAVALIIALIVYFVKNRQHKKVPAAPVIRDTRSPIQRLRDDLTKIRAQKTWEINSKQFYSELSEAVKTYLELEERIAALESTTQEIRPEVMALSWKTQFKVETIAMLEEGDMVKFAKATSSVEAQTQHLLNMETLLRFLSDEEQRQSENKNV